MAKQQKPKATVTAKAKAAAEKAQTTDTKQTTGTEASEQSASGVQHTMARWMERYAEGVEKAIPRTLDAVGDAQRLWAQAARTTLTLQGTALRGVGLRGLSTETAEGLVEEVSGIAGEAQKEVTRASLQASADVAKAVRARLDA